MMQTFRFAGFGALLASVILQLSDLALAQTEPTPAAPKTETFGRWSTTMDEVNTGEDVRKTCAASTVFFDANGTSGTLTLAISNGDVLPPGGYPSLIIAVRNSDLPKGDNVPAVFRDVNDKIKAGFHLIADEQWMMDNKPETTLAILRAMRRTSALDVSFADTPVATISMDGFTKAYRYLGTSCGFPTGDVAP
ncbi:hypothetical protein [Mesorhizobium sp. M0195]|uniref:hypothetical protein n=1 Tax=Mesorhizobium sp. M0195 TaxID=2956910 RepID=UPI003339DFEE